MIRYGPVLFLLLTNDLPNYLNGQAKSDILRSLYKNSFKKSNNSLIKRTLRIIGLNSTATQVI